MRIELLGVPIDAVTRDEALSRVSVFLDGGSHMITTPNPEMLVMATRDERVRDALRAADLAIADGIGLLMMAHLKGKKIPQRITGVDFMQDIIGLAAAKGKRVFFLGAGDGVARQAADVMKRKHPELIIAGAESGGSLPHIDAGVMARIRESLPDVLFVAFGHGKQEKWIVDALPNLPAVRVAMGVGGSFDFIAGRVKRAPKVIRMVGLEWLWRLIREPWRLRRIWTAVVVFPWLVLSGKR